ncbi:MAG TPA: MFS transporter [Actinomycetota bacterium]|nr:MFS transporter [Actinomycetota bacterium]
MNVQRTLTPPRTAVRRLAAARIISITGGAASYVALNYTIFEKTDSAAWVAAALLLTFGVTGFVGPITGVLGDRYDRRMVLIVSDLAGAACFALMAFGEDPTWLLFWAFLSAVAEAPFWSASEAAIPNVAGMEHLSWANSLLGISRSAGITIGPAIGGLLVAGVGSRAVFAGNAVSFVISAVIVWSVRAEFNATADEERGAGGLRAGFVFLLKERVLRTLLLAWVVFIMGMGMAMVADVPLAEDFGTGAFGYGMLITAWGGGSVVGSWLGRYMKQGQEGTWLVWACVVIAAMGIGIWFSPSFELIVAMLFVFGLADGTTFVADQNLRQRRTPDAIRSRVTAAFVGALHALLAISYVAAAVVVPWIGAQPTYGIGGITAGLAVFVLLRMRRYLRRSEPAPDAAVPTPAPGVEEVAAPVPEGEVVAEISLEPTP